MQSSAEPLGKAVRSPPWLRGDEDADAERLIVRGASLDETSGCFDDAGSAAQDEVQQLKALLAAVTERAAAAGVVFEDSFAAELDAVLFADEGEQLHDADAAAASDDDNDDDQSRKAEADACAASADNDDDYREPSSWVESGSVPLPPPPPQSWTAASDDGQFQVDDTDEGSPVQAAAAAGVYSGSSAQEVADFALMLDDAVDQWDNDDDPGYVSCQTNVY
jgi:hypothetical protein